MFTKYSYKSLIVILCFLCGFSSFAQSAEFSGGASGVFVSGLPANFSSIRVTGPGDFFIDTSENLIEPTGGTLLDGQYSFEVSVVSAEQVVIRSNQNNGRSEGATRQQPVVVVESGGFRISNGQIAVSSAGEEEQ